MLDKILLPLLFLLPMIRSNELNFNLINDSLCQDGQTRYLKSEVFNDNEDSSIPNGEVISCYSSDLFLLSDGIIEIGINADSSAEYDSLTVIVYEKGETYDSFVVKKDIFLENIQEDDLRIYLNVTSNNSQGYVLLFSYLSKTSNISIKSIQFTPLYSTENINPPLNIIRDGIDLTTTIVTIPFPTVGEIATNAPDTTIVTVPFPTIGQLPTTTPIVTIPFPTVSNIATAEDTTIDPTTIITVPFPTIGEIITFPPMTEGPTDTTSTIVTIPFPTVGEIEIVEATTAYPDETEESTGLSTFAIIMITIGCFAFVILIGFIGWYLFRTKKTLDIKSNV